MSSISQQYPPPFASEEGAEFAWQAAHKRVKDGLIDTRVCDGSSIRRVPASNLILQFKQLYVPDDGLHLGIIAGILRRKRRPLFLRMAHIPDILNCLGDPDRIQLASIMFWEHIYNIVEDRDAAEDAESDEESELVEEYTWNGGVNPGATQPYQDAPTMEQGGSFAEYREIIQEHPELRGIYFGVLNGTL